MSVSKNTSWPTSSASTTSPPFRRSCSARRRGRPPTGRAPSCETTRASASAQRHPTDRARSRSARPEDASRLRPDTASESNACRPVMSAPTTACGCHACPRRCRRPEVQHVAAALVLVGDPIRTGCRVASDARAQSRRYARFASEIARGAADSLPSSGRAGSTRAAPGISETMSTSLRCRADSPRSDG